MSSLLARFAGNIFWMARYMERAENIARILDINETYARDNREGPDWLRILDLYGDGPRFRERYDAADPKSVLAFYVIDRDNPASIVSCFRMARENARSVRHLISTEMWTHLNIAYIELAALNQVSLRPSMLSRTLRKIILHCQTFEGISEGTFFKGEPWCFYELGKYIERGDETTRILDMGYTRLDVAEGDAVAWGHWNVLLRSVSGYHAFAARHPGAQQPSQIVSFLLYDIEFPRAVALCVKNTFSRLDDIQARHPRRGAKDLKASRRSLELTLETGPGAKINARQLHAYLDKLQRHIADLADEIARAYFNRDSVGADHPVGNAKS